MEKSIITFSANEQNLQKTGGIGCYASDTVSYIEAHFALGENWSGYDSIRAVWFNDYKTLVTVLNPNGICIVPHEVLTNRGKEKPYHRLGFRTEMNTQAVQHQQSVRKWSTNSPHHKHISLTHRPYLCYTATTTCGVTEVWS